MIATVDSFPTVSIGGLHGQFLKVVLPRIESHAALVFRSRKAEEKAELLADATALAWKWTTRLVQRGKDPTRFPTAIATLVCRAVRCGRRITRMESAKDVLSKRAQQRHDFRVERLPATTRTHHDGLYNVVGGQRKLDDWEEHLQDNVRTPIPEQANFRLSYPRFMDGQTDRNRRIAEFLAVGNSGKAAAQRFGLSPCRITQIRQRLCKDWHDMHDEQAPFERERLATSCAGQ
ncbi:hypothetical protein AYO40_02080 [Planctomycetaceae bacterium SCGC AG-212-D15]|nr:hypothetical protein AYO40_02080 [Planctomycetaceae bacterium SCGC AG-212-D15]